MSKVYERYGFERLETGAFEYADALGKFLPDADRPNEGVFALQDDDKQWIALRYDLTAPLARYAAQNWPNLPKPFRRYAVGTVWRNEKPGPGRYREFVQCDADTVGSARPEADAEIIAMAAEALEAAGLPRGSAVLRVSSRKLLNGLLSSIGINDDRRKLIVLRAIDKLDRLGPNGVRHLLGAGRRDESGDFTPGAELSHDAIDRVLRYVGALEGRPLLDNLAPAEIGFHSERSLAIRDLSYVIGGSIEGDEGLRELERIDSALNYLQVDQETVVFDPSVVRGLEYYTGPVFEAELCLSTLDEKGRQVQFGSIGGGGRYDDLVARFMGDRVPATGFSFGVSRLAAALKVAKRSRAQKKSRGPVIVATFDESDLPECFKIVYELRNSGISSEVYLGKGGPSVQFKYADIRNSPIVIMYGETERSGGYVTIKNMDEGKRLSAKITDNYRWRLERPGQHQVPRSDVIEAVRWFRTGRRAR